jgi:hypothetical protein
MFLKVVSVRGTRKRKAAVDVDELMAQIAKVEEAEKRRWNLKIGSAERVYRVKAQGSDEPAKQAALGRLSSYLEEKDGYEWLEEKFFQPIGEESPDAQMVLDIILYNFGIGKNRGYQNKHLILGLLFNGASEIAFEGWDTYRQQEQLAFVKECWDELLGAENFDYIFDYIEHVKIKEDNIESVIQLLELFQEKADVLAILCIMDNCVDSDEDFFDAATRDMYLNKLKEKEDSVWSEVIRERDLQVVRREFIAVRG